MSNNRVHCDIRYYNAGEKPTHEVLEKHPELVHRVKMRFGVHPLGDMLYENKWADWRLVLDTAHLLIRHRPYIDKHYNEYPVFNETNIINYPYTFGEMVISVWNPNSFKLAKV